MEQVTASGEMTPAGREEAALREMATPAGLVLRQMAQMARPQDVERLLLMVLGAHISCRYPEGPRRAAMLARVGPMVALCTEAADELIGEVV
jgi:hypothetical protein